MKSKFLLGMCMIVFIGILSGCGDWFPQPLPDLHGREVRVVVDLVYPPFSQIDPQTGQGVGWDYDVIGELGRRLNFKPVFVPVPFDELIEGVAAGQYDMGGGGISNTYQRAAIIDFSNAYFQVDQRLMVRAGEKRFSTLVDVIRDATLRIGAISGTVNYDTAVLYFGMDRVTPFVNVDLATQALLNHEIDGIVLDDIAFWAQSGAFPDLLSRIPGTLYGNLLGFIFPKGSDLVSPVNAGINSMQRDGSLETYIRKWLPE